ATERAERLVADERLYMLAESLRFVAQALDARRPPHRDPRLDVRADRCASARLGAVGGPPCVVSDLTLALRQQGVRRPLAAAPGLPHGAALEVEALTLLLCDRKADPPVRLCAGDTLVAV